MTAMKKTDEKRERRIKSLFAIVAVLLPLQYVAAVKTGEPYPAIVMPSFGGWAVDPAGRFWVGATDVTVFFSDGSKSEVPLRTIFDQAPESHYSVMAEFALKPKEKHVPEDLWGGNALARLLKKHVVPGYVLSKERRECWAGVEPSQTRFRRNGFRCSRFLM